MKNIRFFLSENFPFLVVKFSIYLNRSVFVMLRKLNINICISFLLNPSCANQTCSRKLLIFYLCFFIFSEKIMLDILCESIHMKSQVLFSLIIMKKKIDCCLLQFFSVLQG